eukprot:667807-Pleurochrysis_carterae.AAC.3
MRRRTCEPNRFAVYGRPRCRVGSAPRAQAAASELDGAHTTRHHIRYGTYPMPAVSSFASLVVDRASTSGPCYHHENETTASYKYSTIRRIGANIEAAPPLKTGKTGTAQSQRGNGRPSPRRKLGSWAESTKVAVPRRPNQEAEHA